MPKADLHLHTDFSDGLHSPRQVVQSAAKAGLSIIAVTDHDTMEGALRAHEYSCRRADLGVEVILGEEVSTLNGHVLGYFLNKFVPPRLSAKRTVELIHQQGGLAVLAHPFHLYTGRDSKHLPAIELINEIPFDGVEIVNHGDALSFWSNRKALKALQKMDFAHIGSSDAHNSRFIGMGYTQFSGINSEDLRKAILERKTTAHYQRKWNFKDIWVHLRDASSVLSRYSKKMASIQNLY
jgi:predicted metal-dependent phosphoesterase TrpH